MRTEMTRYSKSPDKSNRKNTLVTIQDGDVIYFGISRCNTKAGDKFLKSKGQMVAKARAIKASIEARYSPLTAASQDNGLTTHFGGLRGFVAVAHIHDLLQYFRDIDNVMRKTGNDY
jgi:hypothetical protein